MKKKIKIIVFSMLLLVSQLGNLLIIHAEDQDIENASLNDTTMEATTVVESSTVKLDPSTVNSNYNDNGIDFDSTGTSGTIAQDIENGEIVTIIGGAGTITLGSTTSTSQLNIMNDADIEVVGDGNTTLYKPINIYGDGANVKVDNLAIAIDGNSENYGVSLQGDLVNTFTLGENAKINISSTNSSGIFVESDTYVMNVNIEGNIISDGQGIGVSEHGYLYSLMISGMIEVTGNYTCISTNRNASDIMMLTLTETGILKAPSGIAIYSAYAENGITSATIDGTIEAEMALQIGNKNEVGTINSIIIGEKASITTTGIGIYLRTPQVDEIEINGELNTGKDAIRIQNTIISQLTLNESGSITTAGAYSAIAVADKSDWSEVALINLQGSMQTAFAVTLQGASVNIMQVVFDSDDIQGNSTNPVTLMHIVDSNVDNINMSENTVLTTNIQNAILNYGQIGGPITIEGVIDLSYTSDTGFIFYSKFDEYDYPISYYSEVAIENAFLFGNSNAVLHGESEYTNITPEIIVSNGTYTASGITYDIEVPNMDNSITDMKIALLNADYDVLKTYDIDPHGDEITVPYSINEDYYVANYAQDDEVNKILILSGKSSPVAYLPEVEVDADDVTYYVNSSVNEAQFLIDSNATTSTDATMSTDLSTVNFNSVGEYSVVINSVHNYVASATAQTTVKVNIVDYPYVSASDVTYYVGDTVTNKQIITDAKVNSSHISSAVIDTSNVDFNKVGDYKATITVVDQLGTTAQTDITVHIIPKSYTITYELNGGINNNTNPESYTYGIGVASFADAKKEGYKFDGWYSSNDFDKADMITNISLKETGNKTLYAKWIKIKDTVNEANYTVEYYAQQKDGSFTMIESNEYTAEIGTTVKAVEKNYDNFHLNKTIKGTLLSGNVKADGSLTLRLYYTKDSLDVTITPSTTPKSETETGVGVDTRDTTNKTLWIGILGLASIFIVYMSKKKKRIVS